MNRPETRIGAEKTLRQEKGDKEMKIEKKIARLIGAFPLIALGCLVLTVGLSAPVNAESDSAVVQTGQGVGKIVTSPVKIPENVVDDAEERDPVTGTVTGTVKGTGEGVKQIGEGTADVIEAPLKIFK